jgi:hypothetical protein
LPIAAERRDLRSADVDRVIESEGGQAVREFRDHRGREWRAWEVSPESISPQTKAEDYLAECFQGGWLVFETLDGSDKRRLCPPPYAWDHRSESDLAQLVERAEILRPIGTRHRRPAVPNDLPPNMPPEIAASIPRDGGGNIDMRYLGVVRSFRYPGGEIWRARVVASDEDDGSPVLLLASDTHSIELAAWPPEWVDMQDEQLVELLRTGESLQERRRPESPRRRHGDFRADR